MTDASDAERDAREWWNAHWTQSDGAAISSLTALLRQREEGLLEQLQKSDAFCDDKHILERRVEALNARVAMLREVLERLRECFDDGGEYDGHALVPVEGFTERVKAAEAALSGTGTDWLDQLKEQVVSETLDSAIAAVKAGMRIEWLRVPKLGSADAPEGRDG